jgi:ferritin-like protein
MASETLHEDVRKIGEETVDTHRAISSLMEELEAVDWYEQRVKATDDAELREILAHNRDEEKEHAAMVLEWLRRRDATLSDQLKAYLFKEGPIRDGAEGSGASNGPSDGCLGIGSLKSMPAQAGGRRRAIS